MNELQRRGKPTHKLEGIWRMEQLLQLLGDVADYLSNDLNGMQAEMPQPVKDLLDKYGHKSSLSHRNIPDAVLVHETNREIGTDQRRQSFIHIAMTPNNVFSDEVDTWSSAAGKSIRKAETDLHDSYITSSDTSSDNFVIVPSPHEHASAQNADEDYEMVDT